MCCQKHYKHSRQNKHAREKQVTYYNMESQELPQSQVNYKLYYVLLAEETAVIKKNKQPNPTEKAPRQQSTL